MTVVSNMPEAQRAIEASTPGRLLGETKSHI